MGDEVSSDDVRPAFWAAFWSASRALSGARDAMLARHGVLPGQHAILARLWAADNQSLGDLARALDITTSAMTSAASKMEEGGLIERRTAGGQRTLQLTRRGRDLEKILDREMRTLGERALGSLDQAARVRLIHYLRELRHNTAGS